MMPDPETTALLTRIADSLGDHAEELARLRIRQDTHWQAAPQKPPPATSRRRE